MNPSEEPYKEIIASKKNARFVELQRLEDETKLGDMPRGFGDELISTWKEDGQWSKDLVPSEFFYFIEHKEYDNEDCETMYYESASSLIDDFETWMYDSDDGEYGYGYFMNIESHDYPKEFTVAKFNQLMDWALSLKHKAALVAAEH